MFNYYAVISKEKILAHNTSAVSKKVIYLFTIKTPEEWTLALDKIISLRMNPFI